MAKNKKKKEKEKKQNNVNKKPSPNKKIQARTVRNFTKTFTKKTIDTQPIARLIPFK